jgi:CRP-like cAMP-binding protein
MSTANTSSSLNIVPFLAGLAEDDLSVLERFVFEKRAGRGDIISLEGEPTDAVYTVTSGVVKTYKTSAEGKEQIFRIVRPGETFNDAPVLGNDINLITAEAMGPVVLLGIKTHDMKKILEAYPLVARNAIKVLAERVQSLVSLVEDFSFLHVNERVAKMLLQYADSHRDEHPRMTQQEMASLIGTAREMVGRSLKNLEEEGLIRMERNRIVISDENGLKRLAGVDK